MIFREKEGDKEKSSNKTYSSKLRLNNHYEECFNILIIVYYITSIHHFYTLNTTYFTHN